MVVLQCCLSELTIAREWLLRVGMRCLALQEGGIIFGWLQLGGGRNPFISLVLIGDAQSMHKFQRCADA
jgi:hypothetical protein